MTKEQRQKASQDQIERFFYSYYTEWRFAKILLNDKVLKLKYDLLKDIVAEIQGEDDSNPEALIAQELTNGLQFDMLAHCLQYIEDLFALLKAGQKKNFFIRSIITYNAGQIENLIKQNHSDRELCELFQFPYFTEFEETSFKEGFTSGMALLKENVFRVKEFYQANHFFYNQYKHGLTVALRPFGPYNAQQIQQDKAGTRSSNLVAFDNLALSKVSGNKHRGQGYVLMPCLTINTQPFLTQLQAEDNLIRYVWSPPEAKTERIKECAFRVRHCMHIFVNNLLVTVRGENPLKLRLPAPDYHSYEFTFPTMESTSPSQNERGTKT